VSHLTVNQLCERWACSRDQVLCLIRKAELRAFDLAVRHGRTRHKARWRIPLAEVEAFEKRRTVSQPAPKTRKQRREEIPTYV
jgi:hypothetical protein